MNAIFSSPLFGIFLSVFSYLVGVGISKNLKTPIANPLLIATLLCVTIMKGLHVSYDAYMQGGRFISMWIGPATAMLGLLVYRQRVILKEQFFPIIVGCSIGSGVSIGSTVFLSKLFSLRIDVLQSLLPKSVTTAIAMDLSEQIGGLPSVTVMCVVLCGILGAVLNPLLIKIFHITDPVAIGVGMGTASHAVGTAKALEMGELEGAVSGVSIGVAGIITVIILMVL